MDQDRQSEMSVASSGGAELSAFFAKEEEEEELDQAEQIAVNALLALAKGGAARAMKV